jgi:hypothetical protein
MAAFGKLQVGQGKAGVHTAQFRWNGKGSRILHPHPRKVIRMMRQCHLVILFLVPPLTHTEDQKRLIDFELHLYNGCSIPNGFDSIETTGTGEQAHY